MIKFCLQCQHLEMMVRNSHLVITGSWLLCNVILNLQNFSAPTNAMSGRPAYSLALYQIKSAIGKLLVSFWCQVKIREGQDKEYKYYTYYLS